MISSFGAILVWKSDDDDAAAAAANTDDYDDDRKSDPYMSPIYAGDTKTKSHTLARSQQDVFLATYTFIFAHESFARTVMKFTKQYFRL